MKTTRLPQTTLLLLCLALTLSACQSRQTPPSPKPNIVLIMADDLGYGDLSCYGNERIQTPHLDQLAAEGMRFTDYHSNGAVCSPTRAALMSGLYQQRVGITGVVYTWLRDSLGMASEVETMAEIFQANGYITGIFGKWHLGYKKEFNPIRQGFDEFKGFVAGNVDYHSHLDNQYVFDWWEQDELKEDPGYTTDLITRYGLEFLEKNQDQPFLLYLPYAAPHDPYQGRNDPPIRTADKSSRSLTDEEIVPIYQEMVEVLDDGVGQVVNKLKSLNLAEHTLVIFCSDNGANKRGSNGILRGFKGGLYEGGHRVPAMAWWPGKIPAGQENPSLILSMDWLPTLMDLAEIPLGERALDGQNISSVLLAGETLHSKPRFWRYNQLKAVRSGDWKLVQTKGKSELFNLADDPGESLDLSEREPERLAELQKALADWESALP
jgi:arylsulfatase A